MVDNKIYHHGVKGMHWGVRKDDTYDYADKVSKSSSKVGGSVYDIAKTRKYREYRNEASSMSDEDLKKYVDRASLEDRYANYKSNSSTAVRGAESVKNALNLIGGIALTAVTAGALYSQFTGKPLFGINHK